MRFKVTGGSDGLSGIEVAGRRYEPGETIELTSAKAEWLVAGGYLESADGKTAKSPAPVEDDTKPAEPAEQPSETPQSVNDTEAEVTE